jgi:branched-chain amino acid transport system permease protein
VTAVLQALGSGVTLGLIYAGLGAGFSVVAATGRLYNLAHGEWILVGGYALFVLTQTLGWPWLAAVPVCAFLGALLGAALLPLVRRLPQREIGGLALTLGVAFILQNLLLLGATANYRILPGGFWFETVALGPVGLSRAALAGAAVAGVSLIILDLVIRYSWTGAGLRAASQSSLAAASLGIAPGRMEWVAFLFGGAIAAVAGGLVLLTRYLTPGEGPALTLVALAVAFLARRPRALALMAAGVAFGVIESMATVLLGGGWREVLASAFIILWLLLRRQPSLLYA